MVDRYKPPAATNSGPAVIYAPRKEVPLPDWAKATGHGVVPIYATRTLTSKERDPTGMGGEQRGVKNVEYGEPIGYMYDNGKSQYVYTDLNGGVQEVQDRTPAWVSFREGVLKPAAAVVAAAYGAPYLMGTGAAAGTAAAGTGAAAAGGTAASGLAGSFGMSAGLGATALNTGALTTGMSLVRGQNIGDSLKNGLTAAAMSPIGSLAQGATSSLGTIPSTLIGGAATGGAGAALTGKDIGKGALNGVVNAGVGMVGAKLGNMAGGGDLGSAVSSVAKTVLKGGKPDLTALAADYIGSKATGSIDEYVKGLGLGDMGLSPEQMSYIKTGLMATVKGQNPLIAVADQALGSTIKGGSAPGAKPNKAAASDDVAAMAPNQVNALNAGGSMDDEIDNWMTYGYDGTDSMPEGNPLEFLDDQDGEAEGTRNQQENGSPDVFSDGNGGFVDADGNRVNGDFGEVTGTGHFDKQDQWVPGREKFAEVRPGVFATDDPTRPFVDVDGNEVNEAGYTPVGKEVRGGTHGDKIFSDGKGGYYDQEGTVVNIGGNYPEGTDLGSGIKADGRGGFLNSKGESVSYPGAKSSPGGVDLKKLAGGLLTGTVIKTATDALTRNTGTGATPTVAPPPTLTNAITTANTTAPTMKEYAAAPTMKEYAALPTATRYQINSPYGNQSTQQAAQATTTRGGTEAAQPVAANPSVKQFVESLDWSAAGTPASTEKLKAAMTEYGVSPEVVAASAGYPLEDVHKLLATTPPSSMTTGASPAGGSTGVDPGSVSRSITSSVMGAANMTNPYSGGVSGGGGAGTAADKAYNDWVNEAPALKAQAAKVGERGDKLYNTAASAADELRNAARGLREDPALKAYREYAANLGTKAYEDQKVGQSMADVSQQANAALGSKRRSDAARGLGNRGTSNADALQIAGMKASAAAGARTSAKDAWGSALGKSTQMDVAQGELSNKYDNTALQYGTQAAGAATMGLDAGLKYSTANTGALTSIQNADSTRRQAGAAETSAGAAASNAATNSWKAQADDKYNWANLGRMETKDFNDATYNNARLGAETTHWGNQDKISAGQLTSQNTHYANTDNLALANFGLNSAKYANDFNYNNTRLGMDYNFGMANISNNDRTFNANQAANIGKGVGYVLENGGKIVEGAGKFWDAAEGIWDKLPDWP